MFIKISKSICSGMTLAEVMIALGVSSILLLAVCSIATYSGRSLAGVYNYTEMNYGSRQALDIMTRDIRQAARLKEYQTNRLVLVDFDGQDLAFEYSPSAKTLVRTKGTTKTPLMQDCEWMQFALYKQNPLQGTYNLLSATNVARTKVIGVSWYCSKSLLGTVHSEPMQEAMVLVRKN